MTASQRILFNTLATYGRSVFALVLGLFSSRWVLGALGKEDFGLFGLVGSIIVFVGLLNGIMSAAVSRYYAYSIGEASRLGDDEGRELVMRWFNVAFSIHAILPIILIAVGYPLGVYAVRHWLVIPEVRIGASIWVFRFALFSTFLNMVSVPYLAMYRAKQLIAELSFWGMLSTAIIFVCAYLLNYYPGDRLIAYAFYMTVLPGVIILIQVVRARRQFSACVLRRGYLINIPYLKKLFSFAFGEFFGWIGGSIRDNGMPFLINVNFGTGMNAAYTIANQVSGQTASLSSAMIGALMPAVTTAEGEGDHEKVVRLSLRSIKFGVLLILVFCIPLILEIDEVLRIWLINPPEYTAVFCRCVLVALVMHKLGWGHHLAILAKGRIVAYQATVGIVAALGLAVAWAFVRLGWGAIGVGVSFVVIYALMTLVRALFAKYLCGMSLRYWVLHVVLPLFLIACLSGLSGYAVVTSLSPSLARCLGTGLASVVVLISGSMYIICDKEEKAYIVGAFSRVVSKFKAGHICLAQKK